MTTTTGLSEEITASPAELFRTSGLYNRFEIAYATLQIESGEPAELRVGSARWRRYRAG